MRILRLIPVRFLLATAPLVPVAVTSVMPASLRAQEALVQARRFTVDDGLDENRVVALVQDRSGFVWTGTRRGLQRFDGYSFTSYAALDRSAPRELSSSIYGLLIDSVGRLLIAAARPDTPNADCCAFFLADSLSRRVARLPITGRVWTLDADRRLWVVDDGALKWMRVDGDTVHTVAQRDAWKQATAITVVAGRVWLGISRDTATVTRFDPTSGESRSFPAASVKFPHDLRVDAAGRVWLSAQDGFELLDPGANRFRALVGFANARATNVIADGTGGYFVATDYWLARMDSAGTVTERWSSPDVFGVGVLPTRLASDQEGGVWMGSLTGGLIRLDPRKPPFDYRSSRSIPAIRLANDFTTAVLERADGTLWVGTFRGGAYRISPDWSVVRAFRHDPRDQTSLAADEVWDIEEDSRGNVWVATTGAICRHTGDAFRCARPDHARSVGVTDIARDASGWLWLAIPPLGIASFDPVTERFGTRLLPSVVPSLPPPIVTLYHDSTYLWIGMGDIFRVRVANGQAVGPVERVRAFDSPERALYHFHRDRRGTFWIGSDAGLHRLPDESTGSLNPIDLPELRGTTVFSISEDSTGLLWLGTGHGLVRFSPEQMTARRYGRSDGFRSGELNRRAALRRRTGDMLFGGVEGLTQFDPALVAGPRASAAVVLTRWRKVTANGAVDDRIDGLTALRVEPHDRAFTIEFSALSFAPDLGRRYRYRIDGLNSDWVETTDHLATYSTPRPGHYVFRVQTAAGADGEWSVPGTAVALDVIPPFWATSWFRAMLGLAVMALLWMAHGLRLRQAVATERVRLQISRDLHDEIGAGLSSIALLSDSVSAAGRMTERDRSKLQRISESARGMVTDLRDIVWAIDPEGDRLEDVLGRMRDVASDLLRDMDVTFRSPPASQLADKVTMSARRDLLLLFKELLHNIAKHSRASSVQIELEARPGRLQLVVSDDGVGFDQNDVRSGTGLKSLRQRAERLGGDFQISSERGHGTKARLTVGKP